MIFPKWPTYDYVASLALDLANSNKHMTGADLIADLNARGLTTLTGRPYSGKRGVFSLIRSCWHELRRHGHYAEADAVARAFTKADGTYAYE